MGEKKGLRKAGPIRESPIPSVFPGLAQGAADDLEDVPGQPGVVA